MKRLVSKPEPKIGEEIIYKDAVWVFNGENDYWIFMHKKDDDVSVPFSKARFEIKEE